MSKATIKEVAEAAEVSTATVSRVVNQSGFVSADIKERVMAAIVRLDYRPSAVARSLKRDKTDMIGVVVPDISNPYFMGISKGIEDAVGQEGFQLMFCSTDENPEKESRLLRLLYEKRMDAIVLAAAEGSPAAVERIARGGVPVVLIDRRPEPADRLPPLDLVAEDNVAGAYRLARRLLEDGHAAIGVVNGPARISTGRERFEGVVRALREKGLERQALIYHGDFSADGGVCAVRQFLAERSKPTAIISLNNQMTFGVLLELIRQGLRIPRDMAVASFGEVEAGRLLKRPGIYYVDQHPYDMGRRAGELLLARLRRRGEQPRPVVEIFSHEVKQVL